MESNDSPEIPDGGWGGVGETSDITDLPSGAILQKEFTDDSPDCITTNKSLANQQYSSSGEKTETKLTANVLREDKNTQKAINDHLIQGRWGVTNTRHAPSPDCHPRAFFPHNPPPPHVICPFSFYMCCLCV